MNELPRGLGNQAGSRSASRARTHPHGRTTRTPSGTVTFLFSDIEGSTRLLERLRGAYADVLAEHRRILRDAFASWDGHEVDTQGDSFFVAFSRASDAVNCAIAAQRALAAATWPTGVSVRVRMGIHTGEPLVSGADYVGMDVHRAARVAAAGHGGQVLVSGTTRDIVLDSLPDGVALKDLGAHRLKDLRTETRIYQVDADGLGAAFAPLVTAAAEEPPPTPGEAPYRGLEAFEEADAGKFFGREELVARLAEQVAGARFVALVGASGSGKSSILRAGVIPALRAARTARRVLLLTPTAHPLEELAASVEPDSSPARLAALTDDLRADPRSLALAIRAPSGSQPPGAGRTVIAVDQLEEVFTLCRSEDERQAFLAALIHASGIDEGPADEPPDADRASVVVTLRADFYAYLAPYPELRSAAAASQTYVGAMTPDELRRAIEEPARLGGWDFTPGLVDLLLRDVGNEPGALPLLSHALLETWQRRRGTTMTLRSYSESGGVKGAIARTADRVYDSEFTDSQRREARDIFIRLTELGEGAQDTRRRAALHELIPSDEARATEVRQVIKALADARLLSVSEDAVEVAHEALIREWPTLREWLGTDRENLRVHRRLTDAALEWEVSGMDDSLLYRGTRLAQARESTQYKGVLNPLEQRFLDASVAREDEEERQREQAQQREIEAAQSVAAAESRRAEEAARSARQLRRRAFLLTGLVALAVVLAGVAALLARQSDSNAALAAQRAQEAQDNAALADQRAQEARDNAGLAEQRAKEARDNAAAAQSEARRARARGLGADAAQVLLTGREPELAALLALTGLHVGYTAEADSALQRASRQISGRHFAHNAVVDGLAVSPDGKTVYSASDGSVHIWDALTGRQLGQLPIPNVAEDHYWQIKLSDDGRTLFASDYVGPAVLYRIDPSDPGKAQPFATDCPGVTDVGLRAMSRDGRVLAVTRTGETFTFVELPTCLPIGGVVPVENVNDPELSDDGTLLVASVRNNTTMKVWDVATGQEVSVLDQPGDYWHASFSSDGSRVVTGMFDGTAMLFDSHTGHLLQSYPGHSDAVVGAIFSPDQAHILTSSQDGTARLWDVTSAVEQRRFVHEGDVWQAVMTPDGQWIYTASNDATVRGWSATGEASTYTAGEGEVTGLAFSADGTRVASAGGGKVRIYDLGSQRIIADVPVRDARLVSFFPDDSSLLAVSGFDSSVLDPWTGALIRELWHADTRGSAFAASISADGSLALFTAPGTDSEALLFDMASGNPLQIFQLRSGALSPDGTRVVGWFPGRYTVSDALTGETSTPPVALDANEQRLVDIEFTPDGEHLISGDHDNVVRVRNAVTGATELEMAGHAGPIRQVRVSIDGRFALTAGYDGAARLWDLQTGDLVRLFPGHEGRAVTSVAFSPDGNSVAIGSADGTVILAPTSLAGLETDVCSRVQRQLTAADRIAYGITNEDQPCP